MNNPHSLPISDLLSALTEDLSEEDIVYASVLSDIANAITRERIRRNLTQSEFAALLGVSQAQVSKWENEDTNFTIRKLAEISTKLDLELSCTLSPHGHRTMKACHSDSDNITYLSVYSQSQESWRTGSTGASNQYDEIRKEM